MLKVKDGDKCEAYLMLWNDNVLFLTSKQCRAKSLLDLFALTRIKTFHENSTSKE